MKGAFRPRPRKMQPRMDVAGAVDAQNAPTAPWIPAQNAVSHSAHTPPRFQGEEKARTKPSTHLTHEIPDTPSRLSLPRYTNRSSLTSKSSGFSPHLRSLFAGDAAVNATRAAHVPIQASRHRSLQAFSLLPYTSAVHTVCHFGQRTQEPRTQNPNPEPSTQNPEPPRESVVRLSVNHSQKNPGRAHVRLYAFIVTTNSSSFPISS